MYKDKIFRFINVEQYIHQS